MEQGVFEGDIVLLRFKFMSFFDVNPKVFFFSPSTFLV